MSQESRRPLLSARDKVRIQKLYMRGMPPREIAVELRSLGLTARAVTNLAHRSGWGKQRAEIEQAKRESAAEIVARVRGDVAADLESVLRDVAAGAKTDAVKLKDGWDLVEDAAGASSLMRAKGLLLNRVLRLHGLDHDTGHAGGRGASVALVFARLPEAGASRTEAAAVNVTGTAVAEGAGSTDGSAHLEFDEDDEHDTDEHDDTMEARP